MTIPRNSNPDLYADETTATAIAATELIHAGEFELADHIVASTDVFTLLEGFTNALGLAVQLIARHGGFAAEEVFDLMRSANNFVSEAGGNPTLGEVPITI